MNAILQWLSMGGYAIYVWSAYGLVGSLLIINILAIKWQKKKTYKQLQRWFRQSEQLGAMDKMPSDAC